MYIMAIYHHAVDQWWAAAAAEHSLLEGFTSALNSPSHTAITIALFHPSYPQRHGLMDF